MLLRGKYMNDRITEDHINKFIQGVMLICEDLAMNTAG